MPVEATREAGGGLILVGRGVVTGSEIQACNDELYASRERILGMRYQLTDLTGIEHLEVTIEEIRAIAAQDRAAAEINPHIVAAVVGSQDVVYGLARMWEAYVEPAPFETAVFRSLEEARAWIEERLEALDAARADD